ncbi:MAG: hypothetical protein CFE21_06005 [Bacteroidetes bacterium B1(2017)]|nr:MAG: hypothetical protein CFE21_06005 [Bacteroidetes bacterium B1(2017)]
MTGTSNGRYCSICKKEVFDFTTKSISEIRAKSKGNLELCGLFYPEQVNTDIIAPIETPRQIKFITFLSTLLLTIFAKNTFSQNPQKAKTEQIDTKNKSIIADTIPINCDSLLKGNTRSNGLESKMPFLRTKRKQYYWTKKFPFITKVYNKPEIRARLIMGRYM